MWQLQCQRLESSRSDLDLGQEKENDKTGTIYGEFDRGQYLTTATFGTKI